MRIIFSMLTSHIRHQLPSMSRRSTTALVEESRDGNTTPVLFPLWKSFAFDHTPGSKSEDEEPQNVKMWDGGVSQSYWLMAGVGQIRKHRKTRHCGNPTQQSCSTPPGSRAPSSGMYVLLFLVSYSS